jgi:hypothetical protein
MTVNKLQYSVVYDDEFSTSTWTYDLTRFKNGPVSVSINYKDGLEEQLAKKRKYYKKKTKQ